MRDGRLMIMLRDKSEQRGGRRGHRRRGGWLGKLHGELRGLLAPVFAQARSRFAAFAYISALLAEPGDRKSCWQLAEEAGHRTPRRMQALLAEYRWDWKAALKALQRFVVTHLGDPEAVLVLDETAELKKGQATAGVARQHAGITGQVENCQTVVFAAYVTGRAHALFDFLLYLPRSWCQDTARRQRAHVPADVEFATKTQLGTQMVTAAISARIPFAWVAGDEVYGRSSKLREACQKDGKGYVLAVPVNFTITLACGRRATVASVARLVPATAWEMRSCGPGCKGHRDYEWAWAATSSPRHWLLVRRSRADPSDLAFFYCHAPERRPVSLPVLIRVAGRRWRNATSRERGRPAWTSTRSGPGTPSTGTPCCPCARSRCWPSPPPARHRHRGRTSRPPRPPGTPPSPQPGATPANCPPPQTTRLPGMTPAWSKSASPKPAASSAWPQPP